MVHKSLDGNLTKKAYAKTKYTEAQLLDLKQCADKKTGYLQFMKNHMWIQHPTKGRMKFEPFEYQERLLETYNNNRFAIAMCARQTGKTTCAAGYLLWYAMFHPDVLILIAAHKYQGAQDIMQRVRFAYEESPDYIRCGVTSYNKGSMDFDNGSRIIAQTTTETTGRGMSISLVYMDEFAFVEPQQKASEFWTSLSPTLSTGGKCIITSTPNNDDDVFAGLWRSANKKVDEFGQPTRDGTGINGFRAINVHWSEHPDRDEQWAKDERARIGEERFRREHDCEFIAFDETLIDGLKLITLAGKDPLYKTGQVRWYERPRKGNTYVVALDPSLGTGGDYSAIQVFSLPEFTQVAEWQHNKTTVQGQVRTLLGILKDLDTQLKEQGTPQPEIYWTIENNTLGEAAIVAIEEMGEDRFPGFFTHEPRRAGQQRRDVHKRKGFNTTHKAKLSACSRLKNWVETGKLQIHSRNLIRELKVFVAKGNSFSAKLGENDDLVSASLLCCRLVGNLAKYDPIFEQSLGQRDDEDGEGNIVPMPMII
tara:strand:- start:29224 stop:30831 length:1608 start_codon:yes stop_codon:yes gene_type:complete